MIEQERQAARLTIMGFAMMAKTMGCNDMALYHRTDKLLTHVQTKFPLSQEPDLEEVICYLEKKYE